MELGCKNTTLFYTRDINRCVFPVFNTCWDFFATWSGVFTCLLAKKNIVPTFYRDNVFTVANVLLCVFYIITFPR